MDALVIFDFAFTKNTLTCWLGNDKGRRTNGADQSTSARISSDNFMVSTLDTSAIHSNEPVLTGATSIAKFDHTILDTVGALAVVEHLRR